MRATNQENFLLIIVVEEKCDNVLEDSENEGSDDSYKCCDQDNPNDNSNNNNYKIYD